MSGEEPRLTRRAVLAGAAAAGAGALVLPSAGAAVERAAVGSGAGRVFARWIGSLRGESPPIRAPRRFALAGVQWSGRAGTGSTAIELRARRDGGSWSPWALASVQGHEPDRGPRSGARFGEPVWIGSADLIQLRSSEAVDGVALHFVAAREVGALASAAAFGSASAGALASGGLTLDAGPGQPRIIARSVWAGRHAPPAGPASYGSIRLAFVHHTENPNGYTPAEVPAMLLAIFDYHRYVRGYFDIAYNFILDAFGRIWEARAGGIDEPVIGAHAGGFNAVSTGVAVLGSFISAAPPARTLAALQRLLAWKLSLHGLPALGRVGVRVDPAGASYTAFKPDALVRLNRVSGHRDGDQTNCPGDAFYARLPALRPRIAKLARTPARLTLTPGTETVTPDATVMLRGRLTLLSGTPIPDATVELQRLVDDRVEQIASVTTAADGTWTFALPVTRTITLRALHRRHPASVSDVVTVRVRPVLTLALESSSPPRITGTITPPKATVTIATYRVLAGRRQRLATRRVRVSRGRFSAPISLGPPPTRHGRVVVIATTQEGGGTLAGQSAPLTVDL